MDVNPAIESELQSVQRQLFDDVLRARLAWPRVLGYLALGVFCVGLIVVRRYLPIMPESLFELLVGGLYAGLGFAVHDWYSRSTRPDEKVRTRVLDLLKESLLIRERTIALEYQLMAKGLEYRAPTGQTDAPTPPGDTPRS